MSILINLSIQGLQILLMSGVSVTSALQILGVILEYLESSITTKKAVLFNIPKQVSHTITLL